MLRWALSKIVMRAAGDQAKTACGNLQMFTGIEADIEGTNHATGDLGGGVIEGEAIEEE